MIRKPKASPHHKPVKHRATEEQTTRQSTGSGVYVHAPGGSRTGSAPSHFERLWQSFDLAGCTDRETRELENVE